ncbi:MAG TPA: thioredoxin domain-containing protein [Solirubrobacterales bacterium]|nr:thioredoxin domain-containing protein [Solirubrobacterales bacterium]
MNAPAERRAKLLQVAAGAAFLALAVVVVLIVVNASGGGDGGDANLESAGEVNRSLRGIPQEGMLLGYPGAPVELVEFGDLQCPYCAAYAEEVLPPIIENQVKKGQVKIGFRNFTIIGPESADAAAAALAAGAQGRGWNFIELFYGNQGGENTGYAGDETFLEAVAEGAGVEDLAGWNEDRADLAAEVEEINAQARQLGLEGTPTFAIRGPKADGLEVIGTPGSASALEEAIEGAR